ncbi:MAG: calcium/sodium antiporter [Thermoplasmata archaeon]|nr:calcium/sodium antiporter [Thermoplasmata archaeon]
MADALLYTVELVIGILLLVKGSDIFIDGAAGLAKRMGISEHVIGLTLVAFATSLPELAVSSIASFNGAEGIAIGNVIGSNVANICLVLGIAAIIMQLKTTGETRRDSIFMVAVTLMLFAFIAIDGGVGRIGGLIFLGVYVVFIFHLYRTHSNNAGVNADEILAEAGGTGAGYWKESLMILFGAAAVVIGAHFLVESGVGIAGLIGISDLVIGLTMVALGTSLPELASSVAAALKGKHGIAIGNVVGSNIINILLVLGVAGMINPIRAGEEVYVMMSFLLFVSVAAAIFASRKVGRREGVLLLALYALFVIILFL